MRRGHPIYKVVVLGEEKPRHEGRDPMVAERLKMVLRGQGLPAFSERAA